jgi:hypothetical protein
VIQHGEVVCEEIDLMVLLMSEINEIDSTQIMLMHTAVMGQRQ